MLSAVHAAKASSWGRAGCAIEDPSSSTGSQAQRELIDLAGPRRGTGSANKPAGLLSTASGVLLYSGGTINTFNHFIRVAVRASSL